MAHSTTRIVDDKPASQLSEAVGSSLPWAEPSWYACRRYCYLRKDNMLKPTGTRVDHRRTTKRATGSCAITCAHGAMRYVLHRTYSSLQQQTSQSSPEHGKLRTDCNRTSPPSARTGFNPAPLIQPSTPNALPPACSFPSPSASPFLLSTPSTQSRQASSQRTGMVSTTLFSGTSSSARDPSRLSSLGLSSVLLHCRSSRRQLCSRRSSRRF